MADNGNEAEEEMAQAIYIDRNVIVFLRRFRPLFATCQINLRINTDNDLILPLILDDIWPMFRKNIHAMELSAATFRHMRQFDPPILNSRCPSLGIVSFDAGNMFPEFPPADENAAASDGQAVAKWLFTARPDGVPKLFKSSLDKDYGNLASRIAAFKAAFFEASSAVNFIVVIRFPPSFATSVVPFVLTNVLTHEQLELKRINNDRRFLLIRCPIARDESKWTKWEKEAIDWEIYDQWNRINIEIHNVDDIGDWLVDEIPDPSDLLQQT
ncbi:hypothetical protein niasHT_032912 [Heterodera trifolii]|uniref:Uncharacterized protein n=1 Tax=Heterodera trifolii TaxID=157864 RepID=A0ABD2ILB0_9BILA